MARQRRTWITVVAACAAVLVAGGAVAVAPPLTVGSVRVDPRCLTAGSTLKLNYAITKAARVTFTVQRRTASGLATPNHCPSLLKPSTRDVAYAGVGAAGVDAPAGPGYVTVDQSGGVARRSVGGPTRRHALTRTVTAVRGRHTISLLRAVGATAPLTPGRYRILVQARDTQGETANDTVWFWALRSARR